MQDELAAIDVSPLERLMSLKEETDTLEQRLEAMEQRKSTVAEPVYQRVRADYENRRRALEQEAAPLKAAAREQYVKLFALLGRSEADHEAARLDREEIEFRRTLGEFDDTEYQRRLGAVDQQLAARAAVKEQALALRQRFVAAFRSEEELKAAEPARPAPVAAPAAPVAPPPPSQVDTLVPGRQPPAEVATRQLPTLDPASVLTPVPMSPPEPPAMPSPPPPLSSAATQTMQVLKAGVAGGAPARPDQTVIIRSARLVPQNAEAGKLTHTVGLKPLMIGSGEDCDVRVPGCTQRHAEVRVSMAGFTVSDLGGGLRVNGVAIEQHLLRHEDVLELGAARFVFREG